MRGWRTDGSLRLVAAAVALGALLSLALAQAAFAQQVPSSAELKRVIGRVEILRKGQTQWIPAVIGARLVEGDDIRAFSGAQVELALPDTSTVLLAENSRLLINKIEYDQQNQSRLVLLHLVVGKLRAAIAQTAITLVRARLSNFGISTPTAVAAARGTVVVMYTDGFKTLVAVEFEPNLRFVPSIECITVAKTQQPRRQMVLAGYTATDCGPAVATQPGFLTMSNPATAGTPLLNAAVSVPGNIEQLVTGIGDLQAGAPPSFSTTGPAFGFGSPSSFGVDAAINQAQGQVSSPSVASPIALPE